MDLESIYLVENLSTYNFEDTIFLASDIDAIVEKLMHPIVLKEVEKILFLAHVLKTTIDICRNIVHNYETLEELLKVNWSSTQNGAEKLKFYEKLATDDPVKMVAIRILLTRDGARSLGIMQEFYRMHYSKETFKAMLANVQQSIPSFAANNAFNCLKASVLHANSTIRLQEMCHKTKSSNITDIVMLAHLSDRPGFTECVQEFRIKLSNPINEDMLNKQILVLRKLFNDSKSLQGYQDVLKLDQFYDLNMTVLKLYHDRLLSKNVCYDSNIVMLLYLLQSDSLHDTVLRSEFLNESRFGSLDRLRIVLLELQNFR
uniref:Uncharacterized protein n=1 Tax=Anopheles atroparvus TaxID=41427 RepID=A0AAG5CPJ8_ANOAO